MSDRTIIYYTSCREKESFEKKVRENILKVKGDIPLISVSQKPINFGKNICVGKLEQNYTNAFYQALVGCEAAKTDYVVMCEDDCLYPESYFNFKPTDLSVIYTYDNVWLMWNRHNRTRFYKHGTTAGSIIIGRKHYIKMLKGEPPVFQGRKFKWKTFTGEPLVNVKTRNGISFGTQLTKRVKPKKSFPLWGTVEDVKRNYEI